MAMVEKLKAVLSLSLIQPEDNDSSGGMSSSMAMTDIQENTWYRMTFTVQTTFRSYQSWITTLKRYCPLDPGRTALLCSLMKKEFSLEPHSICMHVTIYCSSSIDDIHRRVQDLVEEINDSRTSDQKLMDGFEEKLLKKVQNICNAHGPILHY